VINAIVLIRAHRDRLNEVADQLIALEEVKEVHFIAGRYDLVATLRARDDQEFADVVTQGMLTIEGIRSSETLIAIRSLQSD
jgi:DNA-binding Lrp family transcriptional regulator